MKKLLSTVFTLLSFTLAQAQEVEMADTMRANGKIYVVVAMVLVVMIGMIIYLFLIDRKTTRLEEKLK